MSVLPELLGRLVTYPLFITACTCYQGVISVQNAMMSRVWHTFLFAFYIISIWILYVYGYNIVQYFPILNSLCPHDTCSILLIYRLSFAVSCFHISLAIILFGVIKSSDSRAFFQNDAWQIKFPYFLCLLILSAFIPEYILIYYGWMLLTGGLLFLIVQLLMIVDLSYTFASWSATMNVNEETHNKFWKPLLITSSLLMIFATFYIFVYMFYLLEELTHCHVNVLIILLDLGIICVITFISFYPKIYDANPSNGLFPISVVSLFATYLTWNAVIVNDPGQCTADFVAEGAIYWITVLVGSLYAVLLIMYNTMPSNYRTAENFDSYNYTLFHILSTLGCMYIAMIATNWAIIRRFDDENVETSLSWAPVVFNVFSLIILFVIYVVYALKPLILNQDEKIPV